MCIRDRPATATGTGIVMTSDGYIITNAHVINDTEYGYGVASSVSVLMSDKTEYEATIKGYDAVSYTHLNSRNFCKRRFRKRALFSGL